MKHFMHLFRFILELFWFYISTSSYSSGSYPDKIGASHSHIECWLSRELQQYLLVPHEFRDSSDAEKFAEFTSLWRIVVRPRKNNLYAEHEREREMFYLTTHSTHFIYGYMASDIWLRTILIVRKETRCRHIGYSYRLTARVILYAPSHRQDNTYHGLCCTSRGALAGTRNSSMGPPHEGSIRRPIAP